MIRHRDLLYLETLKRGFTAYVHAAKFDILLDNPAAHAIRMLLHGGLQIPVPISLQSPRPTLEAGMKE